ncbi:hypothetical protein [Halosolutus halophilus]|uniref:hypothetical protein n=1 Tax=Halosolutus halophilus TaxID=1552990 RepID=UPI0022351C9F|nr:hypothetical protein [Halosolutus halophilus]
MQVNTRPKPDWEAAYQQYRGPEPSIDEAEAVAGPEGLLTDGGEDSHTEPTETPLPMADGAGDDDRDPLHVGDHVQDVTEDDDEKTMIVVETTPYIADEYRLEGTNKTVADVNPEFDPTDIVYGIVYPDRTTKSIETLKSYAFPRGRLERVAAVHDVGGEE